MAPELKKIAQQYVQEQLANMKGQTPASRQVDAAVKKIAAALQEVRKAAATKQSAKSKDV